MGHQSHQCKLNVILAGNLFLLSDTFICLSSLCADRFYEIGPRSVPIITLTILAASFWGLCPNVLYSVVRIFGFCSITLLVMLTCLPRFECAIWRPNGKRGRQYSQCNGSVQTKTQFKSWGQSPQTRPVLLKLFQKVQQMAILTHFKLLINAYQLEYWV